MHTMKYDRDHTYPPPFPSPTPPYALRNVLWQLYTLLEGHKPLSQISTAHMSMGLDHPLGYGHLPVGTSAKETVSSPQGLSTTNSSSVRDRNWRPHPHLVRILTALTLGRYYEGLVILDSNMRGS